MSNRASAARRRSSDFHGALIGEAHHHFVKRDVLAFLDHGADEGFVCVQTRGASCWFARFRLAFCGAVNPTDCRRSSDAKSFRTSTGREPALRSFQNAITQIVAQCTAHPNHPTWLERLNQNRSVMSPRQRFNRRRTCLSYDSSAFSAKVEPLPPAQTAGSGGGWIANGLVMDSDVDGPF